jgi:lycopene beta-cyclase
VTPSADVLVVGAGPAGRALAGACARAGLRTTLVDPAPHRPFAATYGCWTAELPAWLPDGVVAARAVGRAIGRESHDLGWEYAVLDVPALRAHLDEGLDDVEVVTGRVAALGADRGVSTRGPGSSVRLTTGAELLASVVVDAAGRAQPLAAAGGRRSAGTASEHPEPPVESSADRFAASSARRVAAEQTAFGIVVPAEAAAPLVAPGEALFMDWRPDHGEPGWPTFLYGIPLGGGMVLLEETSLARRPGLPVPVLRRRLHARLARYGIVPADDAGTETVRFPVDRPRHHTGGVLGFGAAAPFVHPASGFSIATSLRLAEPVATALAARLPRGPGAALAAAREVVWSRPARAVDRFRRIGLEAMLRMPPDEVPGFFDVFFALPERDRWAYLTGRNDLRGTTRTMMALFSASDPRLRRRLVLPAILPPARAAVTVPGDRA